MTTPVDAWVPVRRTFLLAAIGMTLFAICGSIVPFDARSLTFSQALSRFGEVLTIGPSVASRADSLANVLLYLPIAYLWMATLTVDRDGRHRVSALPIVVALTALLTIALEFVQLWLPARVVSLNDVYAGTAGALAGATVWLFSGQPVTDWGRSFLPTTRPRQPFDRALLILMIGIVVVSLLPLDLTLSARTLFEKVRTGGVMLMPFAEVPWTMTGLLRCVRDAALFIPAGMWLATWRTPAARPIREARITLLAGMVLGTLIEIAQFFVISRVSGTTDIVTATAGVGVGWWWMAHRWRPAGIDAGPAMPTLPRCTVDSPVPVAIGWRRMLAWLAAACAYSLLLLVVLCAPFAISGSKDLWRDRYRAIWSLRLHEAVPVTLAAAAADAGQVGLFAGLSVLLALAAVAVRPPRGVRALLFIVILATSALVASAVEVVQVLLLSRTPTNIDIVLAVIGAAIGAGLTLRR